MKEINEITNQLNRLHFSSNQLAIFSKIDWLETVKKRDGMELASHMKASLNKKRLTKFRTKR